MIHVQDLVRRFGPFTALDGLSFDVERGEVAGFLGVNGAGKTTTMRILAGFLPATSGTVSVAGFDVLRESMEVRRRIGYLPEAVPLYREHRVEEMMRFQAQLHGLAKGDVKRRIAEVLERVQLTDRARTPIGKLSKGLRQRVGLAVALLPNPEVLILDEPTSGLDPIQRVEVRNLLRELAAEHTVLLSSHILPEVEAVAPRLIMVHGGRIVADGTREELVRSLGNPSHVRIEAVVGGAVADAIRLFASIEGVRDVRERGRLGIHHGFDVISELDVREDVGALCAAKSWAVRELSWHVPSVEELFSRVALGLSADELAPGGTEAPVAAPSPIAAETPVAADLGTIAVQSSLSLAAEPSASGPAPTGPPPTGAKPGAGKKIVFNLNPFDQGATRDLSKPKAVDGGGSQQDPQE